LILLVRLQDANYSFNYLKLNAIFAKRNIYTNKYTNSF